MGRVPEQTATPFVVSGPSGQIFSTCLLLVGCRVSIGRETLRADLLVLSMIEFDVILGMDWLSMHGALLDCREKKVLFSSPGLSDLVIWGMSDTGVMLISTLRATKMISKGCEAFFGFCGCCARW